MCIKRYKPLQVCLSLVICISLILSGCNSRSKIDKEEINDLIYNSDIRKTMDSYEINNKREISALAENDKYFYSRNFRDTNLKENVQELMYHKENERIRGDKLYIQKLRYSLGELIQIDVNKVAKTNDFNNFDNIILAYPTVNISPKIEVLHNGVIQVLNQSNEFDIYGELLVKNNLEGKDKEFFIEYSKLHPDRVTYKDDVISIRFNMSDYKPKDD